MIVILIRHALADSAGLLAGRLPGMPLRESGKFAALELATAIRPLGIAALYCSPRERAFETASILGLALGLKPLIDDAFDELDYGEWSGRRIAEMDRSAEPGWCAFNQRRSISRPPLGEWMIEAQIRALMRLRSLAAVHSTAAIGVVTHADIIRAILAYYSGMGLDNILRIGVSPGSLTVLRCDQSRGEVIALNITPDVLAGRK